MGGMVYNVLLERTGREGEGRDPRRIGWKLVGS